MCPHCGTIGQFYLDEADRVCLPCGYRDPIGMENVPIGWSPGGQYRPRLLVGKAPSSSDAKRAYGRRYMRAKRAAEKQ